MEYQKQHGNKIDRYKNVQYYIKLYEVCSCFLFFRASFIHF
jgi:hypothetical protein